MDGLLKEIRCEDEAAASVLEQAGLRADSDLQLLTLHNLGLLFPGVENVKLRRKIFNIIHKQKPIDVLINEFKYFIPHESLRAALTENGVLVDYLKMLKEMKTQMNNDFLDRHISLLQDFRKSQPLQDQDKDEIMDILLKEIRRKDGKAASVLENAGLRADSDLQLLTLHDLGELFPGVENFKRIRKIFDIIHTQKPIDILIKEFKDFIPHESLRAALTENGILTNYLKTLKEMKIQVNKMQNFLDAHINLLEDFRKSQPSQDQDKGSLSSSDNSQTGDPPQIQQDITASSSMLPPPSPTSTPDHPEKRSGSLSSSDNSQTGDPPQIQQDITASSAMMSPPSPTSTPDHPEEKPGSLSSSDNSQTGDPPQIQQDRNTSSTMMSPPSPTSTPDHPEKRSGSFSSSPAKRHNSQTCDSSQIQQDCSSRSRSLSRLSFISTYVQPQKRQVTYKMVVSGVTFDAHKQLLHRLTTSSGDRVLKLLSQEDGEVIIVFCPVVSRMGTDVEAAMAKITGDKPVILVVMHHTYGARSVPSVKTWKDSCKVVLCVHVFYHEKVPGLLPCQENNDAIFKIRTELLNYSVDITESTSGDNQSWFSKVQNSLKKMKQ